MVEHVIGERSTLRELLLCVVQAIMQYFLRLRVPVSEANNKENEKSKITQLANSVQHLEIDAVDTVVETDKGGKRERESGESILEGLKKRLLVPSGALRWPIRQACLRVHSAFHPLSSS